MYTCRLANPLKKMMDLEFFEFLSRYKFCNFFADDPRKVCLFESEFK
jgi:hypothetical protein